jgi:sortase A
MAGLFLLALWSKADFDSRAFQSAESNRFEAALREVGPGASAAAASATENASPPPLGPNSAAHGVLGRIEIPRLRITAIVADGTDTRTLGHAIGHVTWSALPGTPGNCALAGHRDTFLRGLGRVRANDVVRIVTLDSTYTYHVEWSEVVEPGRVDVLDSTATRSLTLITCYPFVFVGHAPRRFVVRARQVETNATTAAIKNRDGFEPQGLTAGGR